MHVSLQRVFIQACPEPGSPSSHICVDLFEGCEALNLMPGKMLLYVLPECCVNDNEHTLDHNKPGDTSTTNVLKSGKKKKSESVGDIFSLPVLGT